MKSETKCISRCFVKFHTAVPFVRDKQNDEENKFSTEFVSTVPSRQVASEEASIRCFQVGLGRCTRKRKLDSTFDPVLTDRVLSIDLLLDDILSFLSWKEQIHAEQVSKRWQRMAKTASKRVLLMFDEQGDKSSPRRLNTLPRVLQPSLLEQSLFRIPEHLFCWLYLNEGFTFNSTKIRTLMRLDIYGDLSIFPFEKKEMMMGDLSLSENPTRGVQSTLQELHLHYVSIAWILQLASNSSSMSNVKRLCIRPRWKDDWIVLQEAELMRKESQCRDCTQAPSEKQINAGLLSHALVYLFPNLETFTVVP